MYYTININSNVVYYEKSVLTIAALVTLISAFTILALVAWPDLESRREMGEVFILYFFSFGLMLFLVLPSTLSGPNRCIVQSNFLEYSETDMAQLLGESECN